jgi:hypothetical protein
MLMLFLVLVILIGSGFALWAVYSQHKNQNLGMAKQIYFFIVNAKHFKATDEEIQDQLLDLFPLTDFQARNAVLLAGEGDNGFMCQEYLKTITGESVEA